MIDRTFKNFRVTQDSRGVVTVTLDVPDRPMNVFDESVIEELHYVVEYLEQDRSIRAAVFTSGKDSGFLAGADVNSIQALQSPQEAERISGIGQQLFNRIANLYYPTVAVIHGPCLGGGLEFVLACRYRIASDDSKTRLGLPEVELGLLPGWGGTQRLPRIVGLMSALPMILEGRKLSARAAKKIGLVDVVAQPDQLTAETEKFVTDLIAGKSATKPQAGMLKRFLDGTSLGRMVVMRSVRKRTRSPARNYPAVSAIVNSVETGLRKGLEKGLAYERRAFGELLFSPACRSLVGLFFQREKARTVSTWVSEEIAANTEPVHKKRTRIAVIGAGVMGAGIAQLAASQGMEVVLKDVKQEFVDAGMKRIREVLDEAVAKGSMRREEAAVRLAAIKPTTSWANVADVDLAIEAVTEKEEIKREVFRELDLRLRDDAIIASNTSALSIQHLAEATAHPNRVAGLHFFNPVHRMHLVEIVRASATSEATLAVLVNVVRKLGKTPVVVADSPGFLVNRVLFPYLDEAVRLVCEGVPTDVIDREVKRFGMPMGPLELLDHTGLDVAAHVAGTLASLGTEFSPTPQRLMEMVDRGWLGRKSGRGFYDYSKGRRGKPTQFIVPDAPRSRDNGKHMKPIYRDKTGLASLTLIQQRLVGALVNESTRCLGEQIVTEPWMVDLALVLGTGFAPFRGGPLRMADQWGITGLVHQLERLRDNFGERFTPSTLLHQMSEEGRRFYGSGQEKAFSDQLSAISSKGLPTT